MTNFKKKTVAIALGAALSVTTLLGGVMLNNSSGTASADEVSPASTIVVDMPQLTADTFYTAVQMHYCGDETTDDITYLHLGTNINPNYGYATYYGYQYDVVAVPSVGSKNVSSCYKWIQAFVVNSGYTYSSDIVYVNSTTYDSTFAVTGSKISGSLTSTDTTFTYSKSNVTHVYFSCVYNGACVDGSVSYMPTSGQGVTVSVGDITFSVVAYTNKITVHTSKAVSCGQYSRTNSSIAAFSYYAV